jgi:hypothetical protein
MTQPRRTPPEGSPSLRLEASPEERDPSTPPLGPDTQRRLNRHIEWAMMQRDGWQDHLRVTVKVAVAEMRLAGLSTFEMARVLTTSVTEHPSRAPYDTESLLTRELRSTALTKLMLRWLAGQRAPRT